METIFTKAGKMMESKQPAGLYAEGARRLEARLAEMSKADASGVKLTDVTDPMFRSTLVGYLAKHHDELTYSGSGEKITVKFKTLSVDKKMDILDDLEGMCANKCDMFVECMHKEQDDEITDEEPIHKKPVNPNKEAGDLTCDKCGAHVKDLGYNVFCPKCNAPIISGEKLEEPNPDNIGGKMKRVRDEDEPRRESLSEAKKSKVQVVSESGVAHITTTLQMLEAELGGEKNPAKIMELADHIKQFASDMKE